MGGHGGNDPQSPRRPAVLVLFPGDPGGELRRALVRAPGVSGGRDHVREPRGVAQPGHGAAAGWVVRPGRPSRGAATRSEEHTSELQSLAYLVCRLLLEKKKKNTQKRVDAVVHYHISHTTI